MAEHDQIFKQITEAYSILSDKDLRLKYDKLIFGESAVNTSSSFENQEEYKHWANQTNQKPRSEQSFAEA